MIDVFNISLQRDTPSVGITTATLGGDRPAVAEGSTPLIAAMRAVVISRIGAKVKVPEEFCK